MIWTPRTQQATIRQEGKRVLVFVNGQLVMDLPWEAALELAKAITVKARKAEELAKANQIIEDEAILARAGVPLSLTDHPDIRKEAFTLAAWGSKLRRYIRQNRIDEHVKVFPPEVKHAKGK